MVTLVWRLLPGVETSLRKRSLNTLLVTWCTDTVSMSPNPALKGDRRAQLQTSSNSMLFGWTPNTLATRLSGTGAWAHAAKRTNAYMGKRSKICQYISVHKHLHTKKYVASYPGC